MSKGFNRLLERRKTLVIILLFLFTMNGLNGWIWDIIFSQQASSKKIVGYYAAWAALNGFTPDRIAAKKLTHINYAFANIGSDLKIELGFPEVDEDNFKSLNALRCINPNLKILISVGGWTWSDKFSDVALTEESRTAFADSCVDFIVTYGLDGVDIDWEYPVSGGLEHNKRRPEDKENFTLLMKKLREKLDDRGNIDGKHYLLSFAGAAADWYVNHIEPMKLAKIVDYANIMTYDMHGAWDTYTDFNAPLYDNKDISPQEKVSVSSSIEYWLNAGFPADKLILGIPFYGHLYQSVTDHNCGLYQTYSVSYTVSYEIIAKNYLCKNEYVRYFHKESKVPWLFNGSTFISYEDQESIRYKTDFIVRKCLGGAMIWELSQDPDRVLLKTLYEGLRCK